MYEAKVSDGELEQQGEIASGTGLVGKGRRLGVLMGKSPCSSAKQNRERLREQERDIGIQRTLACLQQGKDAVPPSFVNLPWPNTSRRWLPHRPTLSVCENHHAVATNSVKITWWLRCRRSRAPPRRWACHGRAEHGAR